MLFPFNINMFAENYFGIRFIFLVQNKGGHIMLYTEIHAQMDFQVILNRYFEQINYSCFVGTICILHTLRKKKEEENRTGKIKKTRKHIHGKKQLPLAGMKPRIRQFRVRRVITVCTLYLLGWHILFIDQLKFAPDLPEVSHLERCCRS